MDFFPVPSQVRVKRHCPEVNRIGQTVFSGSRLVVLTLAKHPLAFIFQKFT